jgi:hypothetical protein
MRVACALAGNVIDQAGDRGGSNANLARYADLLEYEVIDNDGLAFSLLQTCRASPK